MILAHSSLYQEIHQQPAVLRTLLVQEGPSIQRLARAVRDRRIDSVVVADRGTSHHAGRYDQYLLGAHNGFMVALATPSLFSIYGQPPRFGNALVLGISQSGKSPDIVAVLAEARRQGALTATITNFPDSDLGQQADYVINLQAGIEHSLAATKTYTTELAAIALLSATLAQNQAMHDALAAVVSQPDAHVPARGGRADRGAPGRRRLWPPVRHQPVAHDAAHPLRCQPQRLHAASQCHIIGGAFRSSAGTAG